MALDDSSEEEPEELFPNQGKRTKSTPPPNRETKKEREDKLRKMMEDDYGMELARMLITIMLRIR